MLLTSPVWRDRIGRTNYTGQGNPAEVFGLLLRESGGGAIMYASEVSAVAVPHGAGSLGRNWRAWWCV